MTDEELEEQAEAEEMLQEEQDREQLLYEMRIQNYDFDYGDVKY